MDPMVRVMVSLRVLIFRSCGALFRTRREQAIVELALRQQLAIYARRQPRPRIAPFDRAITGMDFFVVPTVRFQLLYAWFVIDHGRWRILHFNVTESPTSAWVSQQLRAAFPDEPTHRFLILDNDAILSPQVVGSIRGLGLAPQRTAFRSPWWNGTAERFVGSVRRELVDHVVILGEDHLRRLLREYVDYYNAERVHTAVGDSPEGRHSEPRPQASAKVAALPRVGGLHHRYTWREAA